MKDENVRSPRNPEFKDLKNDRVMKSMNTLKKMQVDGRITDEEYRDIMPMLDANVDPNEK